MVVVAVTVIDVSCNVVGLNCGDVTVTDMCDAVVFGMCVVGTVNVDNVLLMCLLSLLVWSAAVMRMMWLDCWQ